MRWLIGAFAFVHTFLSALIWITFVLLTTMITPWLFVCLFLFGYLNSTNEFECILSFAQDSFAIIQDFDTWYNSKIIGFLSMMSQFILFLFFFVLWFAVWINKTAFYFTILMVSLRNSFRLTLHTWAHRTSINAFKCCRCSIMFFYPIFFCILLFNTLLISIYWFCLFFFFSQDRSKINYFFFLNLFAQS